MIYLFVQLTFITVFLIDIFNYDDNDSKECTVDSRITTIEDIDNDDSICKYH